MRIRDIHPNLKLRLAMQFLGGLVTMAVIPFMAIYFAQKIGATQTGIILVLIVISGVIGGFIGGHISDKIGRRKIMIFAELGIMATFFFIALCNSPWFDLPYVTAAFFVLNMFAGGMFQPAAQAMIIDVTDSDSRKLVFTVSYWLGNLATAIGGIIGASKRTSFVAKYVNTDPKLTPASLAMAEMVVSANPFSLYVLTAAPRIAALFFIIFSSRDMLCSLLFQN